MSVLVAGAGIGGLATALSLHQAGIDCRVFESVPQLSPLGVGINVLPHAARELVELGLGDPLARSAVALAELAFYSKRGDLIWSESRGIEAGYRWPQFSVHRGTLQMTLYDACVERLGADRVQSGQHLVDWDASESGIRARFRGPDGQISEADGTILIGADGIHSAVRAKFHPAEGAPIWNGAILWRGVSSAPAFLTGRSMIMAGHERQKFVCYPIEPQENADTPRLINWVAEKKYPNDHAWRREDWNRAGDLSDFLPDFEDWDFGWLSVPSLIRAATNVLEYPMVDRDPLERWSEGRVTLLGDAAHPMYPIGSNGASQAILDARFLTRALLQHGLTPQALEVYESERRPATSKIVLANRQNGPEQVMQLVEERAPEGFNKIEDVLSREELEQTAARYKQLAGFDKDELNTRPSLVGGAA